MVAGVEIGVIISEMQEEHQYEFKAVLSTRYAQIFQLFVAEAPERSLKNLEHCFVFRT